MNVPLRWLRNKEVWNRAGMIALRTTEYPVGMAFSFPVPTRRMGTTAYAIFAYPLSQKPGELEQHQSPERWMLLDARTGRVQLYALTTLAPFTEETLETVALPRPDIVRSEYLQAMEQAETLCDQISTAFWEETEGSMGTKQAFLNMFRRVIPSALEPRYRLLAPDFFAWLDGSTTL